MSILTSAALLPKNSRASTRANSVLPTPVGPMNINDPMGRFSLEMPDRERRTARATVSTASSWPMTYLLRFFSKLTKYLASERITLVTGTPVIRATVSAISSLVSVIGLPVLWVVSNSLILSLTWLAFCFSRAAFS